MAEINNSAPRGDGSVRRKGSAIKIDMTPMVDLGFLLITFFMLTAVLTKPVVLPIEKFSDEEGGPRKMLHEKNLLTLVLGEKNKVYWFIGTTNPRIEVTNFSVDGIRKILMAKKADLKDLFVFIKASDQSRYQNLVDILDEMTIADIKRYSLVEITPEEKSMISLKQ